MVKKFIDFLYEYRIYDIRLISETDKKIVYKIEHITVIFDYISTIHGIDLYECSFGLLEISSSKELKDNIILNDGNLYSTLNTVINVVKEFLIKPNRIIRIQANGIRHKLYVRYLNKFKSTLVDYHINNCIYISNVVLDNNIKKFLM